MRLPALAVAGLAVVFAASAEGGTVVAARTLPPGTLIVAGDLRGGAEASGELQPLIGLETRRIIYAGRPVHRGDLGPPTLVERNAIVTMTFREGGLAIRAEGRAVDAGGAGERIRVMNLASRQMVTARIIGQGTVEVLP